MPASNKRKCFRIKLDARRLSQVSYVLSKRELNKNALAVKPPYQKKGECQIENKAKSAKKIILVRKCENFKLQV